MNGSVEPLETEKQRKQDWKEKQNRKEYPRQLQKM